MVKDVSRGVSTFFGLSTDTKPTGDDYGNGDPEENSLFLEMDTGDLYYFHNHEWAAFGS
ncbi:MAG: hypothetical protein Q4F31_09325 [Eubacteriales bacterium]|nr:hypothetical protein [Eubacteriales bacterium]